MKRQSPKASGFTLIELLVVISIIAVLAGLTMPLMSLANLKAGKERARTEIAGLSTALESYKSDNGDYPRDTNTDSLDATKDAGMTASKTPNPKYLSASLALYVALSGDADKNGTGGDKDATTQERNKIYFDFKANMLSPKVPAGTTRSANSITAFVDPFRNPYGYSTKYSADLSATPPATNPGGYNPTFDLWCTVDPAQSQTTVPSSDLWITNW